MKKTNSKELSGIKQGEKSHLVLREDSEHRDYFTAEELVEYNKIKPDFGEKYLQNILEYSSLTKKQNDRNYHLGKLSIYTSIFSIICYLIAIGFLFYIQQFQLACWFFGLGIFALISILWKIKSN